MIRTVWLLPTAGLPVGGRAGGAHGAAGRGDGGGDRAPARALQPQAPAHTRRHTPQAQATAELLAPAR